MLGAALAAVAVLVLLVVARWSSAATRAISKSTSSRRARRRTSSERPRRDRERDRRDDRDRRDRDASSRSRSGSWSRSTRASSRTARVRRLLSFVLDVLNGLPSIVIGIFIFGLIVLAHQQSAIAGGVALAIIMLPLIARSTQEVLALVPETLREASFALGVSRWRTVRRPDHPGELRRHHHGRDARGRARRRRDGAAPLHVRAHDDAGQLGPARAAAVDPADDLPGPREPRSGAPRSGVGGGARALDLRARHQHPLEGRHWHAAGGSSHDEARIRSTSVAPIEVAQRESDADHSSRDGLRHPWPLGVLRRAHPRSSDVNLEIYRNMVTALIGPSGCGKSTFIRCLNRMNDLIPSARVERRDPLPRPGHVRLRRRSGRRCAAGSGWCSRSRTRSRSRSTTTSPGARGRSACARASTSASSAR